MMLRIAWRSLATKPVRAAVLVAGFGLGIAVMVELLGVGAVMLEQSRSPALRGGGDVVVTGPLGMVSSARFVMSSLLNGPDLSKRVVAASPSRSARLYVLSGDGPIAVNARGGIPSLEKALGDPEVAGVPEWIDASGDERWAHPDPADVLRAMDRFHPIPAAGVSGWSEWLYFNGRMPDGQTRFYLTFFAGPAAQRDGQRLAAVRLQLQRDGHSVNYSARGEVGERSLLSNAPDLEIAGNRVRLEGLRYQIHLSLECDAAPRPAPRPTPRAAGACAPLTGSLTLVAQAGRSMPPATIRGAKGWVSGYVVPVLSGTVTGAFDIAGQRVPFEGDGYHDHNWGFWNGVSWQWGQVAGDGVSLVYGRVFPPPDVADLTRVRGFLAVTGSDGPLAFSSDVTIDDRDPSRLEVRAKGRELELQMTLAVQETVRTAMDSARLPAGAPVDFLQLGGLFHVEGRVGSRSLNFTARGSAETFKGREE